MNPNLHASIEKLEQKLEQSWCLSSSLFRDPPHTCPACVRHASCSCLTASRPGICRMGPCRVRTPGRLRPCGAPTPRHCAPCFVDGRKLGSVSAAGAWGSSSHTPAHVGRQFARTYCRTDAGFVAYHDTRDAGFVVCEPRVRSVSICPASQPHTCTHVHAHTHTRTHKILFSDSGRLVALG